MNMWKAYGLQSLLAVVTMTITLLLLLAGMWQIVPAMGSTAFVLFVTPNQPYARPRNVIGGHAVGLLAGLICALIPHRSVVGRSLVYALSVGLATWLMLATGTAHPPAAGTALGIAMAEPSYMSIIAVMTSAGLLSLLHHLCRPWLRDLGAEKSPEATIRPTRED